MKLIVAGGSGFVATEVIRQSLRTTGVTELVCVSRKEVPTPQNLYPNSDTAKFRSVVVKDYDDYSDEAKKAFAGADACIWTVAITPTKSKKMDPAEVRRVCYDCTLVGLKTMFEARGEKSTPFRFMYMSGISAERDQTKTPSFMPPYSLMRGETENKVLAYAAAQGDKLEACVAKPGLIREPGNLVKMVMAPVLKLVMGLVNIDVTEISAGMIDQVINGFDKEPMNNDDLVVVGQRVLKGYA